MKIDGKLLAAEIIQNLEPQISGLKHSGITPKIAIVTLGPEESWKAYVGQKIKLAEKLGVETKLVTLQNAEESELIETIEQFNNDSSIHGIIIQRPVPENIDNQTIVNAISSKKDIDGFQSNSPFQVPVWLAVKHILEFIYSSIAPTDHISATFVDWLQSQQIVVIGKGVTAGQPTINGLTELNINPIVIGRDSTNVPPQIEAADIIISAVGKRVEVLSNVKSGVVLIGIGLHRGEDGKLRGDYDENEVENRASFYTPSPGGVGPVNLAYLFKNLINATQNFSL